MNRIIRKNIQTYDSTVEAYHNNTKTLEKQEIEIRKAFLAQLKKTAKILDLACGPGRDALFFSEKGYAVCGVDLSTNMIKKAKIMAPKATFKISDITHLTFRKESFDAVWFNAGLLCVPKRYAPKILKKICTILRKNGILFISVKEGSGERFQDDTRYGLSKYYAYYVQEELHRLLTSAHFTPLKAFTPHLKSTYHTHSWIGILCRKE